MFSFPFDLAEPLIAAANRLPWPSSEIGAIQKELDAAYIKKYIIVKHASTAKQIRRRMQVNAPAWPFQMGSSAVVWDEGRLVNTLHFYGFYFALFHPTYTISEALYQVRSSISYTPSFAPSDTSDDTTIWHLAMGASVAKLYGFLMNAKQALHQPAAVAPSVTLQLTAADFSGTAEATLHLKTTNQKLLFLHLVGLLSQIEAYCKEHSLPVKRFLSVLLQESEKTIGTYLSNVRNEVVGKDNDPFSVTALESVIATLDQLKLPTDKAEALLSRAMAKKFPKK